MFDTIILHNFQSHKDTTLELVTGVNAIVGASDQGKTSILRAVRWAVHNRPSGTAFASDWCSNDPDVKVLISKGKQTLERIRTKKMNGYIVNGVQLEAIRTDVPSEVRQFFNLSDVNIQQQMDKPFLIDDSPGEIARFFNSIIKLEIIDTYITAAKKMSMDTGKEIKRLGVDITTYENELENYFWVDDATKLLKEAGAINVTITEKKEQQLSLQNTVYDMTSLQETITKLEWVDKAGRLLDKVNGITNDLKQLNTSVSTFKQTISTYQQAEGVVKSYSGVTKAEQLLDTIDTTDVRDARVKYDMLQESVNRWHTLNGRAVIYSEEIETLTERLPDVCPLCGQRLENK